MLGQYFEYPIYIKILHSSFFALLKNIVTQLGSKPSCRYPRVVEHIFFNLSSILRMAEIGTGQY
jgi:hypothetical protein